MCITIKKMMKLIDIKVTFCKLKGALFLIRLLVTF